VKGEQIFQAISLSFEKMNANIWSLQFCCDVFGVTGNAADTWAKCEIRFFRSKSDPAVGLLGKF
jgi:hypothetical protein